MELTIEEIIKATGGKLLGGNAQIVIRSIGTDTRKLKNGDLYVALKGPRFDGHDFIREAISKGACGVVVSRSVEASANKSRRTPLPVIHVPDTQRALGDIAKCWRGQFDIPVVAITGSSGKTTTKDLIAAVLNRKGKVLKTEGNLNNLIGLPLTVFGLTDVDRYAVLEMGMNAFGEIARLTEIARPSHGLITNIGHAHLEGVGDLAGVARAKGELFEGLNVFAVAVINADDPNIAKLSTRAKKITFGCQKPADIHADEVEYNGEKMRVTVTDPKQTTIFTLPMVGEHHVLNWLAAYAVGFELGISPKEAQDALDTFRPAKMRGEEIELKNDITVINDAYNANPDSMSAALHALFKRYPERRRVAVLGEMWELGREASCLHRSAGIAASEAQIDLLLAFGEHAPEMVDGFSGKGKDGYSFSDIEGLNRKLTAVLKKGDVVLVKGSRGSQMERVVEFLKKEFL
ncbi:MAG: UDP-N-acetylmuramoyl-tripeptide--D-alanyl-D-alanine ligase [Deltaproteobacteria bacterium]|nr:UDP-N-acetylmuramoyl-tripeptide--D-alanyl-D-alanine ligase [Deltaproteobacteria bacterium]